MGAGVFLGKLKNFVSLLHKVNRTKQEGVSPRGESLQIPPIPIPKLNPKSVPPPAGIFVGAVFLLAIFAFFRYFLCNSSSYYKKLCLRRFFKFFP